MRGGTSTMTATVTQLVPLRVRVDGASRHTAAEHLNTVYLTVGARVEVTVRSPLPPLIIGTADAETAPAGGSTFAATGALLASERLTADGIFDFINIPHTPYYWRTLKVFITTGTATAGAGVGNHNLALRLNGISDSTAYRYQHADFTTTAHLSVAEANYFPCGRLSEGTYRTHAEITIQNWASWAVIKSHCASNWGATGTHNVLSGGVVATTNSTPVTRITLYNHLSGHDLRIYSQAFVVGYK